MATKRTACEEAADILDNFIGYGSIGGKLRTEGRELIAWRKTALDLLSDNPGRWERARKACEREAKRIQKARTKK